MLHRFQFYQIRFLIITKCPQMTTTFVQKRTGEVKKETTALRGRLSSGDAGSPLDDAKHQEPKRLLNATHCFLFKTA